MKKRVSLKARPKIKFTSKNKSWAIFSIILILSATFVIYYSFQSSIEKTAKDTLSGIYSESPALAETGYGYCSSLEGRYCDFDDECQLDCCENEMCSNNRCRRGRPIPLSSEDEESGHLCLHEEGFMCDGEGSCVAGCVDPDLNYDILQQQADSFIQFVYNIFKGAGLLDATTVKSINSQGQITSCADRCESQNVLIECRCGDITNENIIEERVNCGDQLQSLLNDYPNEGIMYESNICSQGRCTLS